MPLKTSNPRKRNNEKRKEKSRVAAKCRRSREVQVFGELTAAIPAPRQHLDQLDKASVMRLAISYLRVRDLVAMLPETQKPECTGDQLKSVEDLCPQVSCMDALDGFVIVLSRQGDIVYCSENVVDHLGITQVEIVGQSVFEFSHPCDHGELREALRARSGNASHMMLRLKCTLTGKGRSVHLKSASYKVIQLSGHILSPTESKSKDQKSTEDEDTEPSSEKGQGNSGTLVAVGRPIPHPSNIEVPLDSRTFLTKHTLDMKFTYSDDALLQSLGYSPEELAGRSLYDLHHAEDVRALANTFKSLFTKGQCETGRYRLLARRGGYAWVQTQATLITDKNQKPLSVVCVNYVISGIESKDEVLAAHQLLPVDTKSAASPDLPDGAVVAQVPEHPVVVTEKLFAPRNKDMNQGFLMFSPDEGLTVLKDEPEDLTHLAPTPGDACIPLEGSPFDMFDDFILNDNYCCTLLDDELANGSPVGSLGAGSLLLSSPEPQETDSSCGQSSLLTELSLDAFENAKSDIEIEEENALIPPSDELPILESAVMWGALPDNVSLAKPQPSEVLNSPTAPALQQLLITPTTGPPPQDLISNIYSDPGLVPNRSISWENGLKRVMKQEEEPSPKRAKHTTQSNKSAKSQSQSSSVLMNLLFQEMEQELSRQPHVKMEPTTINCLPSVISLIPNIGLRTKPPPSKNPMYSSSIKAYPGISSNPKSRPLVQYSTPPILPPISSFSKLSADKKPNLIQDNDPYFAVKYQASPGFSGIEESQLGLSSGGFWDDPGVMETTDLLAALDDFKLT